MGAGNGDAVSKSEHEAHFAHLCEIYGLPQYEREYQFAADMGRRWRFDFAWPDVKVAVEVDGGQWKSHGGYHARDTHREKGNEAVARGWRVLHLSGEMLADDPERWMTMLVGMLSEETP